MNQPTPVLARAALSALAVGALLMLLRRAHPRAGGLAAALPVNSLPALFWLSLEHGGAHAAGAALGSLAGTGLTALLGWTLAGQAPAAGATPAPSRPVGAGAALAMGAAGARSLLVSLLAPHAGARWCGLVAVTPVVGIAALVIGYREGGATLMFKVLGGYLDGLVAKAAFLAALGLAWGAGVGLWAWPIAFAGGVAALLVPPFWRK